MVYGSQNTAKPCSTDLVLHGFVVKRGGASHWGSPSRTPDQCSLMNALSSL